MHHILDLHIYIQGISWMLLHHPVGHQFMSRGTPTTSVPYDTTHRSTPIVSNEVAYLLNLQCPPGKRANVNISLSWQYSLQVQNCSFYVVRLGFEHATQVSWTDNSTTESHPPIFQPILDLQLCWIFNNESYLINVLLL